MEFFEFELHNSNAQINNKISKVSYTYHINTFPFGIEHGHLNYWEFTIVTDGTVVNVVNKQNVVNEQNTMFYSTTNDKHLLKKKTPNIRYINLVVRETALKSLAESIAPGFFEKMLSSDIKSIHLPTTVISDIEKIIHRINLLDQSEYNKYNDLLCSAALLVLQRLFLFFIEGVQTVQTTWHNKLSKLMNSKEFLAYNVDDLCQKLDYSRMQLSRLFKKYYNTNPHNFLLEYKLQYASNLLKSTDLKIIEIASMVGYAKLSQFNVVFKRKYGVTPGTFRRNG